MGRGWSPGPKSGSTGKTQIRCVKTRFVLAEIIRYRIISVNRRYEVSVTVNEAARLLGVSAHEVRRLVEAGTLTAERRGRMLLVDDASVARRAQTPVRRGRTLSPRTAWAATSP